MKHTVIATREFSIDGVSFLPGDEVDIIELGKTSVEFKSLVHARFLSFGNKGRSFEEVMEAHKAKMEALKAKEEPEIEEKSEEEQEVLEDETEVEIVEPQAKRKRR